MAEIPQGYKAVSPEDEKKAKVFFDRGRTVGQTGNFDFAIEMYLQGLNLDPDAVDAHKELRDFALKRKAAGGKDLGMFEKMKLRRPTKDDKQNLLNFERLLCFEPGNTDHMVAILQNAFRAGYYDTVMWMGPILQQANASTKSPAKDKYIILRDVYKSLKQWKLATDACHYALRVDPTDMNLQTELKNLGAQSTMEIGNYETAGSFRDSIKNMDQQAKLLEQDKDVRTVDSLTRSILEAEEDLKTDPKDPIKIMKLVEALVKSERMEYENRALDILEEQFKQTGQFRMRYRMGQIKLAQLRRTEQSLRKEVLENPKDDQLKKDYEQFQLEKWQDELKEYKLWSSNYPTDMGFRYQMAVRMFNLKQFDEAIPIFQHVRQDPKYRNESAVLLAQAFMESGYVDEAVDTLRTVTEEYQVKGDDRSKDMYYWYGRALELKGDLPAALKCYSQVAMWDFNFRDAQPRIKRLRAANKAGGSPPAGHS